MGSCFDQRPAEIARALLAEWPTEIALFVRQKLGTLIAIARKDDLQVLQEFLELGTVKPVVDRTFALSEVAEAIRYLREGHARGKVVVTV